MILLLIIPLFQHSIIPNYWQKSIVYKKVVGIKICRNLVT